MRKVIATPMMVNSAIWRPIASKFPAPKKVGRAKPIDSDMTMRKAKIANSRARNIGPIVEPKLDDRGLGRPVLVEASVFVIP
jgi:hypothetical protein